MFSSSPAPTTRFFITAGDPSGDSHAARLMAEIRLRIPDAVFEGFGGPAMEQQGLRSLASLQDVAVTGFWEVAKRYGALKGLLNRCRELLSQRRYAAFIPVDYPGFNLRLAPAAQQSATPVIWYIAPQLWAWGADRAKKLAAAVNMLMVVFPFETEFFAKYGIRTSYVGHPLLDDDTFRSVPHHDSRSVVLLPGSRAQELTRHVPLLAHVTEHLLRSNRVSKVVVPSLPHLPPSMYVPLQHAGAVCTEHSRAAMLGAGAGLVKAGTSTLEAALLGLPFATFYRTSWLSYVVSKRLVTVPTVTMANLLLQRPAYREYLQSDATVENLTREVENLLDNQQRRTEILTATMELRELLGGSGAAGRAADVVAEMAVRRQS